MSDDTDNTPWEELTPKQKLARYKTMSTEDREALGLDSEETLKFTRMLQKGSFSSLLASQAERFQKLTDVKKTFGSTGYTMDELLDSPDLPTLLNRLHGLPDDAGPKFGLLAGKPPTDPEGKPRFFTMEECLERSFKRTGGQFKPMSMMESIQHSMIIQKWVQKHPSPDNKTRDGNSL